MSADFCMRHRREGDWSTCRNCPAVRNATPPSLPPVVPDSEPLEIPVTLFIGSSSSHCGACGRNADPNEKSHRMSTMVGEGCGARFTNVANTYIDQSARVREMRPDLIFVGFPPDASGVVPDKSALACQECGEDVVPLPGGWYHDDSGSAFCHDWGGPVASPSVVPAVTDDEAAKAIASALHRWARQTHPGVAAYGQSRDIVAALSAKGYRIVGPSS